MFKLLSIKSQVARC